MSKKHGELMVNVGKGLVLPYRHLLLMQKLRTTLEDARRIFGDEELTPLLNRFIAGSKVEERNKEGC